MSFKMPMPNQTPLYHAIHRDRYERQEFIREMEKATGRRILVYIANLSHPESAILREDIAPFCEIVASLDENSDVDLLLESPGGDPNAAETLVHTLLSRTRHLRVVVPQAAKSAATLISLAADEIMMSDTSELGPIDPQVSIPTTFGYQYRPAQAFLNGLELIKREHAGGQPLNPAYLPFLQGVDAALIDFCHKSIEHSKRLAVKWLSRSMFKNDVRAARKVAEQLSNIEKYPNHGTVIDHQEATRLGLKIHYRSFADPLWQAYWRLYTKYLVMMREKAGIKIFESSTSSIMI
ncbi:SDH family Clp fold serine proteinase [Staphylospora marina]|uniref:SDH family Clp fold serine proteinase n=1 Tax=Staphylospora marina TaxID=2490858 RepID=UPI000F5BFD29|nr:hypothetical protein [Staphylospora marina]